MHTLSRAFAVSMRVAAVAAALLCTAGAAAQPSGGPYGPQPQRYEVPTGVRVHYVSPEGRAESEGKALEQPTTLEAAVGRARGGEAIVLRGGTYRTGSLQLNQGVTFQPYLDEHPVLKGTRIATEWRKTGAGLWRTKWPTLFPKGPASWWDREQEGRRTPLYLFNNDVVLADGQRLKTAGWQGSLDEQSFAVDYDEGYVYVAFDPTGKVMELTAHDIALRQVTTPVHGRSSDGKGPVIRGIAFIGYAVRAIDILATEAEGPTDPAKFGKDIIGTTLENVTIRHCGQTGAYLRGDRIVVRNCAVSDTDNEGLYFISTSDSVVERTIVQRVNWENLTGHFPSAFKIFNQTQRFVARDNVIVDNPNANGIWYDVGNRDGLIINNHVENTQSGVFWEISHEATIAGNVFVNCDRGVHLLNARNVGVYHNTFVNSAAVIGRYGRVAEGDTFGWHANSGPGLFERSGHTFVGNLLVSDDRYSAPLLRIEQPKELCDRLTDVQLKRLDHNVYIRTGFAPRRVLVWWAPFKNESCWGSLKSVAELRTHLPQFEQGSHDLAGRNDPVFRSWDLRNFEPASKLPLLPTGETLPERVRQALGWSAEDARTPGAYPAR